LFDQGDGQKHGKSGTLPPHINPRRLKSSVKAK
jgi:hypothetical protein